MDTLDPNSPVFADTWADIEVIVAQLTPAQHFKCLEMFVIRMASKEATGVSMVHQEIYAMRAALQYAITGVTPE